MSKIILHIDLNQFFVRCEEIKNPSLIGKAVIIGGEGRCGIVSTCSYKAREYGIHSGMPTFQAKMLCKNVIILPVDYKFYGLLSKEFINYIKQYSKNIEQMSIDECFVDLTETYKKNKITNINKFLTDLQQGLFKKTQLKCSIGVAPTKFLAKMGSDIKKPMGITIIRKRDIPNIIFPLKISSFFGIGKKTYPRLEEIGINTIGDLYNAILSNNNDVKDIIGNFSDSIKDELDGNSNDIVESQRSDPKSIGVSRTFDHDTQNTVEIKDYLLFLAKGVIESMILEDKMCQTITIIYKNAEYIDDRFSSKSYSKSFKNPTNNKDTILLAASDLFDKTYKGQIIRLIGFTVKNFKNMNNAVVQMTFDNYKLNEKENEIGLLINQLNREINKDTFLRLSDLDSEKVKK
ncbi:MAG: DNA polymerase IV [Bacilli bacterium]